MQNGFHLIGITSNDQATILPFADVRLEIQRRH